MQAGDYTWDLDKQEVVEIIYEIHACSKPEEVHLGFHSRQHVQELIYPSKCGDRRSTYAVRDAIRDVLGHRLVWTLGQILRGPYKDSLKQISIEILGEQGRRADELLPDLIRMLEAERAPELRSTILEALVRIGQPDDVILPLWIGLEDPDMRVRSSALTALISLGPLAGDAIHGIATVARNSREEPALRLAALRFIQSREPDAGAIIGQPLPSLIESLEARTATAAQPHRAAGVG